jgi:hypothetical protein
VDLEKMGNVHRIFRLGTSEREMGIMKAKIKMRE